MRLIVTIPERWEDAGCAVSWALLRPDGTLQREAETPIGELPAAQRVIAVVPASRVLLTAVKLPARGAQRVRNALAYAVEDQLTSAPESVHAVAGPLLPAGKQSIAVIDKEWLGKLLSALESAGARPHSITVETCLPARARDDWAVVLREGTGFVRTGDASGMVLDRADSGSAPPMLQLALQDARNSDAAPQKIVVWSDSTCDLRAWEQELGVRCDAAGPWRAWQAAGHPAIELLQGEFAPPSALHDLWPRVRPAAILVGAALAIEISGVFLHWGALRYEKAQLEARMHDQFKTAFPQAQAIVDPALQMRRNLEATRTSTGIAQDGDFLPLLAQAARLGAAGTGWQLKAIAYESGRLALDVALADRKQAESLLRGFEAGGVKTSLEAINPNGSGAEARFVFVARGQQ